MGQRKVGAIAAAIWDYSLPRRANSRPARAVCATYEGLSMSDAPKRRLIDQLGVSPTFVAEGCRFTGDVETTGPLVVCGTIRGDGKVGGPLSMAAKAHWEGEIHAQAAVVAGRITGKLVIEQKLEVGASAVIRADIVAGSIAVAKGAVIVGEVTITSGQPIVRFEEKRADRAGSPVSAQGPRLARRSLA